MDQTKTWMFFALFALFTVTAATAQRDHKPLDRGIHKRSLLKGYSVLRGQHPSNRKTSGDLNRISAPVLRLPKQDKKAVQALMPRACQPVAGSIDPRHLRRPALLPVLQRPESKHLRLLPLRRPASVTWRNETREIRPDSIQEKVQGSPIPTSENDAKTDPIWDRVGPGLTIAGMLVGLRAMVLGQKIGDWIPGGSGRAPQGMVLGGVIALLGAILIQVRTFAPIARKVRDASPPIDGMPFLERNRRKRHINEAIWNEVRSTVPIGTRLLMFLGLVFGSIWIMDLFFLILLSLIL